MTDALYELLPSIYRIRDAEGSELLRALLGVVEEQLDALDADVGDLYENWFVETCAEWIVPYIGDLLAARGLHGVTPTTFSHRAVVANTLAYRRRKGTATVLEQLAHDTSGWPARAVEFFQRLRTTQYLNHLRPDNADTPDLRRTAELELLGGPFEATAHSVDVRRISRDRGRYDIPNVGIFLWRLQSYPVTLGEARAAAGAPAGSFTFDPRGLDVPLSNRPRSERDIAHLAQEVNVPAPLRRRALYDELEARRLALATGGEALPVWFDVDPVLEVQVDAEAAPVPPEEVLVCDLSDWRRPPASLTYAGTALPIRVAVDPELGRLAFPAGVAPGLVRVSYAYGFSADLGGGPYDRGAALSPVVSSTWTLTVGGDVETLAEAVEAWSAQPPGTLGQVTILDSRTYAESLNGADTIVVPEGSELLLAAADGQRPHLLGNVSVRGTAPAASGAPGRLFLNGLSIEGAVTVLAGNLGGLDLAHCTLVPGKGGLSANSPNERLAVTLDHAICPAVALPATVRSLAISDSVAADVQAPGADATLARATLFGATAVRTLEASDCLFVAPVTAELRQVGCVRFSYVSAGSRVPRRYRCQPDLALADVTDPAEQMRVRARLEPDFTSEELGQPGFAQLSRACAVELRAGASDGSEMGAFASLQQPQREANVRAALEEYLRFGLEAGLHFVT